jgi:hypothetical protein
MPRFVGLQGDTVRIKTGARFQFRYQGPMGFPTTVDGTVAGLSDSMLWLSDPTPFLSAEPVYVDRIGFVSAAIPLQQLTGFRPITSGQQWAHLGVQAAIAGTGFYLLFSESPASVQIKANPWAGIGLSLGTALLSVGIKRLFFPRRVPANIQNGAYRLMTQ